VDVGPVVLVMRIWPSMALARVLALRRERVSSDTPSEPAGASRNVGGLDDVPELIDEGRRGLVDGLTDPLVRSWWPVERPRVPSGGWTGVLPSFVTGGVPNHG
jgi:hypothetical protein